MTTGLTSDCDQCDFTNAWGDSRWIMSNVVLNVGIAIVASPYD
jgi:hypothetical protein